MSLTGELCWSRVFPGRSPSRIVFADGWIACSYIDGPRYPGPCTMVCLDGEGRTLWSVRDFQLQVALDDGRFVGVTYEGQLRVLDRDGRDAGGIRHRDRLVACGSIASITTQRDCVLFNDKRELLVTDRALRLVDRFPLPPGGHGVLVDDGLVHSQADQLMFSDRLGRTTVIGRIPVELAHDAMDRWERDTGRSALAGWISVETEPGGDPTTKLIEAATDPSKGTPMRRGNRPPYFAWRLGYLEPMKALCLANGIVPPHLVMCLSRAGDPLWCTYLSSGCCGGLPTPLPDGRLVVSSGCGGVVTWLDSRGAVLARRQPFEGVGLASACGSIMRSLADSGCTVDGSQGIVAYGADCEIRWRSDGSSYDYDEQHHLLVSATWKDVGGTQSVTIECARIPGLRSHDLPS